MKALLPAAIEFQSDARQIDERRPPLVARATLYALVALIIVAIAWAAIAKVDKIVVAQGKLITTASTIVLQPLETSVVRTLNTNVGDIVRSGDVLARLDSSFSEADVGQLRDKVASLDPQIERLEAELNDRPYAPTLIDSESLLQSEIWKKSIEQHKAKIASFDQQARYIQAEMATKDADRAALGLRLAVARELEGMRSELLQRQLGSKINYLDAKSQRLEVERDIQSASNVRAELEENLKRVSAEQTAYIAEFREKLAEELVDSRRDRDAAAKQLEKAVRRNAVTLLTAPADAIVLEVAQRSVGSVMKEAEPLFTLVPLDSPLEAEVSIDGRDVGQVSSGATARLKLDAWPFQKHGTLAGQVRTVSNDSFAPDANKDTHRQPYYKARVLLASRELRNVPPSFHLIPGMSIIAEIKAGERSILSYFLYPLLRGFDESIREP